MDFEDDNANIHESEEVNLESNVVLKFYKFEIAYVIEDRVRDW